MKEVTCEEWQKNPTPRMMWVWDDEEEEKVQRKVIYFLDSKSSFPVIALATDESITDIYKHCAEIEKQKRMTKKELARWLREKPTREFKYSGIVSVYSTYTYDIEHEDEEVHADIVVREDDGEWQKPLVEVEE